jgi:hypothetical protein
LQIRAIGRRTNAESYYDNVNFYFNTDSTATNYYRHYLQGSGSTVSVGASNDYPNFILPGDSQTANTYGALIIDILDYSSTSKYKTVRTLTGIDSNDANGTIRFTSGLWKNTTAINKITFVGNTNFKQYSSFALYGIKD